MCYEDNCTTCCLCFANRTTRYQSVRCAMHQCHWRREKCQTPSSVFILTMTANRKEHKQDARSDSTMESLKLIVINFYHHVHCYQLSSSGPLLSIVIIRSIVIYCHHQVHCYLLSSSCPLLSIVIIRSVVINCHHQIRCYQLSSSCPLLSIVIIRSIVIDCHHHVHCYRLSSSGPL